MKKMLEEDHFLERRYRSKKENIEKGREMLLGFLEAPTRIRELENNLSVALVVEVVNGKILEEMIILLI